MKSAERTKELAACAKVFLVETGHHSQFLLPREDEEYI